MCQSPGLFGPCAQKADREQILTECGMGDWQASDNHLMAAKETMQKNLPRLVKEYYHKGHKCKAQTSRFKSHYSLVLLTATALQWDVKVNETATAHTRACIHTLYSPLHRQQIADSLDAGKWKNYRGYEERMDLRWKTLWGIGSGGGRRSAGRNEVARLPATREENGTIIEEDRPTNLKEEADGKQDGISVGKGRTIWELTTNPKDEPNASPPSAPREQRSNSPQALHCPLPSAHPSLRPTVLDLEQAIVKDEFNTTNAGSKFEADNTDAEKEDQRKRKRDECDEEGQERLPKRISGPSQE